MNNIRPNKVQNAVTRVAFILLTMALISCSDDSPAPYDPYNSANIPLTGNPNSSTTPLNSLTLIPPADVNLPASGALTQVALSSPTILNAQGGYQIQNNAPASGFAVGTTQVTWTVVDSLNNSTSAIQNVTIYNYPTTSSPISSTIIALQIAPLSEKQFSSNGTTTVLNLDQPVITGGVPPYFINNNLPAKGLPEGNHTIIWSVTDSAGSQTTAYQQISIVSACATNSNYFAQTVWPVLKTKCIMCHNSNGSQTPFNLVDESVADFNTMNFSMFSNIARKTDINGKSLYLVKPINRNNDHGGGTVLAESSPEFSAISEMVTKLQACTQPMTKTHSLALTDYATTLRKASLVLANRLPTLQETNIISQATDAATQQQLLDQMITGIMFEEAFIEMIKTLFNDKLLTNAYAAGTRGLNLALSAFSNKDYFSDTNLTAQNYDKTSRNTIRSNASLGIAMAPLELIADVVRNDKPFTEILTADFVMVNPYSATVFSANIPGNPEFNFIYGDIPEDKSASIYLPAKLVDKNGKSIPHAGVLSTLPFLARFPSTPSNINRKRAATIFKLFLDTDIESIASRSVLNLDNVLGQFPTLQDPQCKVCHDVMDPVAGLFKNWTDGGEYRGDFSKWGNTKTPPEILPPGFSISAEDVLPDSESSKALAWLAHQIVNDSRFSQSISKIMFEALTGQTTNTDVVFFETLKNRFIESNYNLKSLIKEIIFSDYFRAEKILDATNGDSYSQYGTAHLLTPEQLNGKINAVTNGYNWKSPSNKTLIDVDTYNVLYGGIDSLNVTTRTSEPTGIVAAVQQRVAFQTSCETVPTDFAKSISDRVYFKFVEITDLPSDPAAYNRILQNIQYLFKYLLAENHALNSAELLQIYELFVAAMANSLDNNIPAQCRGNLASDDPIIADANQTVRAWMAVMSFFFLDYKFLYQ